eukprot:gene4062-8076_t
MIIPIVSLSRSKTTQSAEKDLELKTFIEYLGLLGPVILQNHNTIDSNVRFPCENWSTLADCLLDGFLSCEIEQATKLLDSGLHVIFFNNQPDAVDTTKDELSTLPRNRVGLSSPEIPADFTYVQDVIREYSVVADNFIFKLPDDASVHAALDVLKQTKTIIAENNLKVYFVVPPFSSKDLATLANISDCIHVVFEPSLRLFTSTATTETTTIHSPYAKKVIRMNSGDGTDVAIEDGGSATAGPDADGHPDFVSAFLARLRSDRQDGLFTSVVCDEQGVCLGLVYSNSESIRHAVSKRRGIFWSRSRGGLWVKGESSGMWQELLKIDLDCDGDALRFTVSLTVYVSDYISICLYGDPGCFCHLMTRTCWGDPRGLQKMEALLRDRKKAAPEGSYTKRLFDDPNLLRKKLLEETMLLRKEPICVAAGVGISDIEAHLDKRSLKVTRRPGDAKEWRTKAAEQTLESPGSK